MKFSVLPARAQIPVEAQNEAFLVTNDWDDYHYKTQFDLRYVDSDKVGHSIGAVKIARFGMGEQGGRSSLPRIFTELSDEWFSLGQDDSYYEHLSQLGDSARDSILQALRDLALNTGAFETALLEKVTGVSLLRTVSASSVRGQFHRLAQGGARLTDFSFVYVSPPSSKNEAEEQVIRFSVQPESEPPTNIHVLIGRNGVGKTRLLQLMTRALVTDESRDVVGEFVINDGELHEFAGLVSVSFSAFDEFEPLPERHNKATEFRYAYVGLKRSTSAKSQQLPKDPSQLSAEFVKSVRLCRQGTRASRWRRALEVLESDPIFSASDVASLAHPQSSVNDNSDDFAKQASQLFRKLSSGHKIVLLTITRLVETVEEKSLVVIDEPEAHLHPPLLSAFVRSLSDLLANRNGVAIVATHSPVILQEVPRRCVWKLRRNGDVSNVERPEIETFGENVGVLTREVFGLEVTHSGFHRLLQQALREEGNYQDALDRFNGQVGGEGLALLRSIQANESGRPGES